MRMTPRSGQAQDSGKYLSECSVNEGMLCPAQELICVQESSTIQLDYVILTMDVVFGKTNDRIIKAWVSIGLSTTKSVRRCACMLVQKSVSNRWSEILLSLDCQLVTCLRCCSPC